MRNLSKKAKTIIAGAAIAGLASTGVAYAYWTTTGGGSGTAGTGTSQAVTMDQVGSISGLTPDSAPQNVNFSITNPATTNQYIASVTVTKSGLTAPLADGTHPCTLLDFSLTQPTVVPGDLTSGAHTFSANGSTLQLVNNPSANQDGCKGATVSLTFTANAS